MGENGNLLLPEEDAGVAGGYQTEPVSSVGWPATGLLAESPLGRGL